MTKKITEMYAWICEEADGGEGVAAFEMAGHIYPLMGADMGRAEDVRPFAVSAAKKTGRPVKLVKFTNMEIVEWAQ